MTFSLTTGTAAEKDRDREHTWRSDKIWYHRKNRQDLHPIVSSSKPRTTNIVPCVFGGFVISIMIVSTVFSRRLNTVNILPTWCFRHVHGDIWTVDLSQSSCNFDEKHSSDNVEPVTCPIGKSSSWCISTAAWVTVSGTAFECVVLKIQKNWREVPVSSHLNLSDWSIARFVCTKSLIVNSS